MPHPHDQHRYQVRWEWGVDGLARLAPCDVVVVVDVLVGEQTGQERRTGVDGDSLAAVSSDAASIAEQAARGGALALLGSLRNAPAVAAAVLAEQASRGVRTSVAVVAVGEQIPGAVRFAVEDLLGGGAVVDALGALGIDHTSPEAAAAGTAFAGLRGALRHLLTASASGQELIERGEREQVLAAADLGAASVVPALRDGAFVAY